MSAQIQIGDRIIDLSEDVTYNFQIGDIAEISKSKATYTSSFRIPRTSEMEALFQGLGIPADQSKRPYRINDVYLLDDYVPIMKGVLVFMRTDEVYFNVTAISGAFDFFTELGDLRFSDIDISEIIHEKTLQTVSERISGAISDPYPLQYTYGLAYFGGVSRFAAGGGDPMVNIDALSPAVTAKYLWDKIFQTFPRFTFSGDFYADPDFASLWVIFPYPPFDEVREPVRNAVMYKRGYTMNGNAVASPMGIDYDLTDFIEQQAGGAARVNALRSGPLRITLDTWNVDITSVGTPLTMEIWRNGTELIGSYSLSYEGTNYDVWLDAGDFVNFEFAWPGEDPIYGTIHDITLSLSRMTITQPAIDTIFGLSLRAFVKEIMWRYGLLAFVHENHIEFVALEDIINSPQIVDWSDKYVRRTEEEYSLQYNQANWLRHRYATDGAEYYDRNIPVDNRNIPPTKTIIQSELFAPLHGHRPYSPYPGTTIQAREFPIYDPSVDMPAEPFEYKTEQRMFFARVVTDTVPYRLGSATRGGLVEDPVGTNTRIFEFTDLAFSENDHYDALSKVLDHTRVHRIDLLLTSVDVNQINLKRLYYFEQEAAKYMLNKLTYTRGDLASGEFVKVSVDPTLVWTAINPTCQLDNGYRTGLVEYADLHNAATGSTKPNVPSDPDYVPPYEDHDECPPQAVLVVSNVDTSYGDPFRLFVDTDVVVLVNGVQVAYITDVETRNIPVNIGDTIKVMQWSNPVNNPWPPSSRAFLNDITSSPQSENLAEIEFTAAPGVNTVESSGRSAARGMRKYTTTTHVNVPITPTQVTFVIMELDYTSRGIKGSYDNYTSEFNTTDNADDLIIGIHNNTGSTQNIVINGISVSVSAHTVYDQLVPKGDLDITIG